MYLLHKRGYVVFLCGSPSAAQKTPSPRLWRRNNISNFSSFWGKTPNLRCLRLSLWPQTPQIRELPQDGWAVTEIILYWRRKMPVGGYNALYHWRQGWRHLQVWGDYWGTDHCLEKDTWRILVSRDRSTSGGKSAAGNFGFLRTHEQYILHHPFKNRSGNLSAGSTHRPAKIIRRIIVHR